MFVAALQARLKVLLDDETLRLTMLASQAPDNRQPYDYTQLFPSR
jgi:hypothetical protein